MKKAVFSKSIPVVFFVFAEFAAFASGSYETDFGKGQWSPGEWQMVKSSRSEYIGEWIQHQDKLVNRVPDGVEGRTFKAPHSDTFTAMLLKKDFTGDITVELECGFEYRMAPGIIISALPLRPGEKSVAELPLHLEVVLYDHGLNVWYHFFENGVQTWYKAVHFFEQNCFAPGKAHRVIFRIITRKGRRVCRSFMQRQKCRRSAAGKLSGYLPGRDRRFGRGELLSFHENLFRQ